MKSTVSLIFFTCLILVQNSYAKARTPIEVPVVFLEALAPKDTTSSERFQKEYENAIRTAKTLTETSMNQCGYKISEKTIFYDASDSLQALEQAKKAESEGTWLLVGPRRSNHYLLMVKGAESSPSISTMASSKEVAELGGVHLTMAPSNSEMAKVAAKESKERFKNEKTITYVSALSEDCVACLDFAEAFDLHAKKLGLKKLSQIKFVGESPDLASVKKMAADFKPNIVLLPNYSKVSSQVMAALVESNPKILFVGGDGWGDSSFGFVQNSPNVENVRGITVRGFPPADQGLEMFALGKAILKSSDPNVQKPGSGSALAILKIIEGLRDTLCQQHPKTKSDFKNAFLKTGKKRFDSPWGVSVYTLAGGQIRYDKTRR